MPKLKSGTVLPTNEEDRIITRQATEDGTLLTDEQLAEMRPISEFPQLQGLVKQGRPPKSNPKKSTTLRLDARCLDFLKVKASWQTKINAILQDYVKSHHAA